MRGYFVGFPLILITAVWALDRESLKRLDRPVQHEKAKIERDLVLDVERKTPKTIQPGEPIILEMALVNRSKTQTRPVVKPGDGSSVGWREPHVFYTARRKTETGNWVDVPQANSERCGLYDADWQKDVTKLEPGERLELKKWISQPYGMLEYQEPGRHRLYVHYQYEAGRRKRGKPPADLGEMEGVPAFEIVSEPIALEVVRPLDVVVKAKSPLKVKTKTKLSDIFDVKLINRSKKPLEVQSPTLHGDARLRLEIEGKFGWHPDISEQETKQGIEKTLKPNESVSILCAGGFNNGLDGTWKYPVEEVVKVRAIYHASTSKHGAVIKSDWIDVKVEK